MLISFQARGTTLSNALNVQSEAPQSSMDTQKSGIKRKFNTTKTYKHVIRNNRESTAGVRNQKRQVSTNNAGSQTSPVIIMKDGSLDPDALIEVMAVHPYNKSDVSRFNSAFERNGMDTKGSEGNQEIVGVLGSGDYGRAIGGKIAQTGYTVLIGSRDPNNPQIR